MGVNAGGYCSAGMGTSRRIRKLWLGMGAWALTSGYLGASSVMDLHRRGSLLDAVTEGAGALACIAMLLTWTALYGRIAAR